MSSSSRTVIHIHRGDAARGSADYGIDPLADPPPRPMIHRASYPPRPGVNGILISMLCTLLLIFLGFVPVTLPSPLQWSGLSEFGSIQYDFRLPFALMIGALLGPTMGAGSILLFLIVGLFVAPVFAHGGGWQYVMQPGFGYLLGLFFMGSLMGRKFHKPFLKATKGKRSLKLCFLAVIGVMGVHVIGALYLVALSLAGQIPWDLLPGWLLRFSLEPIPYDLLAGTVFLAMVRQIRLSLWPALY